MHYSNQTYQQYKFLFSVLYENQISIQQSQHQQSSDHLSVSHNNDYAVMQEDFESEREIFFSLKKSEIFSFSI